MQLSVFNGVVIGLIFAGVWAYGLWKWDKWMNGGRRDHWKH